MQETYAKAIDLLQAGKTADALTIIDAAIKAGANDPSLYNLKGLAASELGRDSEAQASFRNVIRLSPKSATGYNNLGVLLSKLGRYEDAAVNFREAHSRDPRNFTALLGLGTSLSALHQYASHLMNFRNASSAILAHLAIGLGGVKAVDHAYIDLYPGEVVGLLGHNGAGKSCLIKILSGAYKRDSGQIFIDGQEVKIDNPREPARVVQR